MKKSMLLSLVSASLFQLLNLSSCKADIDYEILKKNADYSDYYTNKDAYSIYYYKQPVTGESDLSVWDRDTESDTTNTYLPAGSSASSLNNKAYEGFVFAGFVQNDTTINVYYKRCTICYEFYNLSTDEKPAFIITGLFGMTSVKPICNDRDEAYFDSWHTQNGSNYTTYFSINADSNTVNDVSTTKWIASWKDKGTVLGSGLNLINIGDVLLKDGSVVPYSETSSMKDEMKAAAVAVLVSNSYNPKTGSNIDGTTRLIAALKPGSGIWINNDLSDVLYNIPLKTDLYDGKTNLETLLNIDKDYRHNPNRTNAILYSYDYDYFAGIAGAYKNDWYLPSETELKLLQAETLAHVYSSIVYSTEELPTCWTSTSGSDNKIKAVRINGGDSGEVAKDATYTIIPFRQLD